ncbi:MAG: hypothetical protein JSU63_14930 [Phycisphaerales bacterium]|nr:MAG: hypothetical protein JSU63_14930 [Phycisphaerales bacterium]
MHIRKGTQRGLLDDSAAKRRLVCAACAGLLTLSFAARAPADIESIHTAYESTGIHFEVVFSKPRPISEGWEFQLFIDADEDRATGYGSGFDLVVRCVELEGTSHASVYETEGGVGPGGWGTLVGSIPFSTSDGDRRLQLQVPWELEGMTGAEVRYAFENCYQGHLTDAVYDGFDVSGEEVPNGSPRCVCSERSWKNSPLTDQRGTFTVTFRSIPQEDDMLGHTVLSQGPGSTFTDFAILIGFGPTGVIDARNGEYYDADTVVPYSAGKVYDFRVEVNVPAHTYSVFITPEGSDELTLATDYAFRDEQDNVGDIDNWGLRGSVGSHEVCNLAIDHCLADSDVDGVGNCHDECPDDPAKTTPGVCGCGVSDDDLDSDGVPDCYAGDADGDGEIDLHDFALFFDCMAGPENLPNPASNATIGTCQESFDFDNDTDVDARDLSRWLGSVDGDSGTGLIQGDIDNNRIVDLHDYRILIDCMAGPDAPPEPASTTPQNCLEAFNLDDDEDVDVSDIATWLTLVTNDL